MAGYALNQNELDQRLGRASTNLVSALTEWQDLFAMITDQDILGLPDGPNPVDPLTTVGYSAGEIVNIRGACFELGGPGTSLIRVAYSQVAVPAPNNFLFHAKHLMGARVTGGFI